jgi:hypothetical protein
MYAMDCDEAPGQLWQIDPVTGDATPVGTPVPTANNFTCAGQGTYDAVTGTSYFIGWGDDDTLASVDLATGVSTDGPILADNDCVVTAGNDGTLYEIDRSEGSNLATIDPTTGVATIIGSSSMDTVGLKSCAMANNPVDDQLYTFRQVTIDSVVVDQIITIDKTTGQLDYVRDVDGSALGYSFCAESMAIDANGIAWVQDDCAPDYGFTAVNLSTGEAWAMAPGTYDVGHTVYPTARQITNSQNAEGNFYQMSIWIVPAATPVVEPTTEPTVEPTAAAAPAVLASTGVNGVQVGLFSGFAALAVIAGLGLVAARRRNA